MRLNVIRFLILIGLGMAVIVSAHAQIALPDAFAEKLVAAQIDLALPLEKRHKKVRAQRNRILRCDFGWRDKRSQLEIRYLIEGPEADAGLPHVTSSRIITTVASNDPGYSEIVSHRIPKEELDQQYGADWGVIYYFHPKYGFSNKRHGKLVALHKEGQATVFIFYLFNAADNEGLEQQAHHLRFAQITEE